MDKGGPEGLVYLQVCGLPMHHERIQACYDFFQNLRMVLMELCEHGESFFKFLSKLMITSRAGMRPVSRATCKGKGSVCAMSIRLIEYGLGSLFVLREYKETCSRIS